MHLKTAFVYTVFLLFSRCAANSICLQNASISSLHSKHLIIPQFTSALYWSGGLMFPHSCFVSKIQKKKRTFATLNNRSASNYFQILDSFYAAFPCDYRKSKTSYKIFKKSRNKMQLIWQQIFSMKESSD